MSKINKAFIAPLAAVAMAAAVAACSSTGPSTPPIDTTTFQRQAQVQPRVHPMTTICYYGANLSGNVQQFYDFSFNQGNYGSPQDFAYITGQTPLWNGGPAPVDGNWAVEARLYDTNGTLLSDNTMQYAVFKGLYPNVGPSVNLPACDIGSFAVKNELFDSNNNDTGWGGYAVAVFQQETQATPAPAPTQWGIIHHCGTSKTGAIVCTYGATQLNPSYITWGPVPQSAPSPTPAPIQTPRCTNLRYCYQ